MINSRPLVRFSVSHPWVVIVTALIITVLTIIPVLHLQIQPDIESLLPEDLDEFYDNVSGNSEPYDEIIILAEGEDLFSLKNILLFSRVCDELDDFLPVVEKVDPFSFVALEKDGARLMAVPLAPEGKAPETEEDLQIFKDRIHNSRFAPGFVTSDHTDALAVYYVVEKTDSYMETMNSIDEIVAPLNEVLYVSVTGTTPFSAETERFLTTGISRLLVFVLLTILASYYLGFRSKRAVFLPITLVISGTVFAIGIMSLLGYKLTVVSIISPPLILTLGSSYSIHVMNAYYRAAYLFVNEKSKKDIIIDSVSSVSSTILLASLTTLLGLLSLMFASIPQTREFALSTALGILFSAFLSVTLLPAFLSLQSVPKQKKLNKLKNDPLSRSLLKFAPRITRGVRTSMMFLVVLAVIFFYLTPGVEFNTSPSKYFPESSTVRQDLTTFLDTIGGYEELTVHLKGNEKGYFLKPEVLEKVNSIETELRGLDNVSYLFSFPQYLDYASKIMTGRDGNFGSKGLNLYVSKLFTTANPDGKWLNADFSEVTIQMMVFNRANTMPIDERDSRELMTDITGIMRNNVSDDMEWELRGTSLGFLKLSEMMRRDFLTSTLIALVFIGLLTSIVFKSVKKGALSLIPLLTGIFASFILMVMFDIPLDMTTIMVSCITIGVGVDDAIHFLLCHRDMELRYPEDPKEAVYKTILKTGRPIVITTISIVAGLLFLAIAKFQPIKYFGLLIVFTLIAACFSTIVILPSIVWFTQSRRKRKNG